MVKRALLFLSATLFACSLASAGSGTIPAGTVIHCRLAQTLSTRANSARDPFTATISEPVMVNGQAMIPAGATLEGRIVALETPGRIRGVGEMQLSPENIASTDGRTYPLGAVLTNAYGAQGVKVSGAEGTLTGPSGKWNDLKEVGIGMGGGGFLGTLIGGVHGAFVGGAIGGAAALADTLRKRGPALTLPTGTELQFQLTRDLVIQ
jgi:hypothetical protein